MQEFDDLSLEALRRRGSEKWRTNEPDVLPAWVAETDFPPAPAVAAALRRALDDGDTGYMVLGGLPAAFAEFAGRRLGWDVEAAHVFAMPDVMTGVANALRLLTPPGARVVINPPVYPPFFTTIRHTGRAVVEVPLRPAESGGWGLDLDRLEAAFAGGARAYLLCSPHNPTGSVFPAADLRLVAQLAERHGVLVIADEVHGPLTLPGAVFTPYLAAAGRARAVMVGGASKAWNLPGLKCAVLVAGSSEVAAAVGTLPKEVREAAGHLGVLATTAALRDGGEWLDRLHRHLDRNRELLGELLADHLPGIRWVPPKATYLAWLDCSACGLGDDPAERFLAAGRVALSSGPAFGREGRGFARLNFGTSGELLEAAVERMARALPSA